MRLLCAISLIHLKFLNPLISGLCALALGSFSDFSDKKDNTEKQHKWHNHAIYSFVCAGSWKFFANYLHLSFHETTSLVTQFMIPNIIISSVVFGLCSLNANYHAKYSVYRTGIIGILSGFSAGCFLISANIGLYYQFPDRFYSSIFECKAACICVGCTLPFLLIRVATVYMSALEEECYSMQCDKMNTELYYCDDKQLIANNKDVTENKVQKDVVLTITDNVTANDEETFCLCSAPHW